MRTVNPTLTVMTSLLLVVVFVVAINLVNGNHVTADNTFASNPSLQKVEGKFNPFEDEEERAVAFEDEEQEEIATRRREDDDDEEDDEDEEDEDWDEEEEGDEEEHFREMEMERMEIEANIGRLESIDRLAEIARSRTAMASYAIMHMEEFVEDEDEAVRMLEELIKSGDVTKPVKNLLKMKLAEVYSLQDRREDALKVFKSMIESK